jgi:predicted amidohydrolase YtcJ
MNGIPADLVLKNGNIITVDAHDTIAEATAVLDGKFVPRWQIRASGEQ